MAQPEFQQAGPAETNMRLSFIAVFFIALCTGLALPVPTNDQNQASWEHYPNQPLEAVESKMLKDKKEQNYLLRTYRQSDGEGYWSEDSFFKHRRVSMNNNPWYMEEKVGAHDQFYQVLNYLEASQDRLIHWWIDETKGYVVYLQQIPSKDQRGHQVGLEHGALGAPHRACGACNASNVNREARNQTAVEQRNEKPGYYMRSRRRWSASIE
ncbi:hypothetical protein F5887DRAFT_921452 [Amanita rubescens]|nr:hypothetical protein F5887DRAFT_921526 [Amanita rubescens]KAF8334473.1 hypothetical protein F5887DRAFT_921452 [Amanita rubescens]